MVSIFLKEAFRTRQETAVSKIPGALKRVTNAVTFRIGP